MITKDLLKHHLVSAYQHQELNFTEGFLLNLRDLGLLLFHDYEVIPCD